MYWASRQPQNQAILGLKAITEPRLTVPDNNTETKPAMTEGNTEQNPVGQDGKYTLEEPQIESITEARSIRPEGNYRTKNCWT